MENKRRQFLRQACAPVLMAALGIPVLEACSSEEDESPYGASDNPEPKGPVSIDLSSSTFSSLSTVGGWMNYLSENLLLIRISDTEIRAFNNACPHQGNRDGWSFSDNTFNCKYHNNSYENSCSGSLTCYQTSISGNTLTVTR